MAYTFTDMSKVSNDILERGIVEMIVKDDPILNLLPFKSVRHEILTPPPQVPFAKSYQKFDGGHKKYEVR